MGEDERDEFKDTIIADLHIHSKYSRATSKDLDLVNLAKWARIKGLNLLGTGDFTHPKWIEEVKSQLKEKDGLYWLKDEKGEFPFMLTSEISLIYTKHEKGKRVHLVMLAPSISVVEKINEYLDTLGRRDYDGRPIFGLDAEEFVKKIMAISADIEIIPAHIWTPHFGILGAKSGFNNLKEAFGEQEHYIHAIETGISSDPEMNWKILSLHQKSIVSFSDAHSFWPWRLGREATIFTGEYSYGHIINQIRTTTFKSTIETEPAYGKYHWDGHLDCKFSCSPNKAKELDGICPVCNKPLTAGVDSRVEKLKDNKWGFPPANKKLFFRILPLHELIAFDLNVGVDTKQVWEVYNLLIEKFDNELNLLLKVDKNVVVAELDKMNLANLAKLIVDNRIANLKIEPGYDGQYGKLVLKK